MKHPTSTLSPFAQLQEIAKPLSEGETSAVVGGAEHLMSAPPAHCVLSFPAPTATGTPSNSHS